MGNPNLVLRKIQTKHGTIQANKGILDELFGETYTGAGIAVAQKAISREAHQRVVEYGKDSVGVDGANYLTKKYKGNSNGGARGGEPVSVKFGDRYFEVRISMTHDQFSELLVQHASLGGEIYWVSQRGTKYGPLKGPGA